MVLHRKECRPKLTYGIGEYGFRVVGNGLIRRPDFADRLESACTAHEGQTGNVE